MSDRMRLLGAAGKKAYRRSQKNLRLCRRYLFFYSSPFFWLRTDHNSRSLLAIAVCDTPNRFASFSVPDSYDKAFE